MILYEEIFGNYLYDRDEIESYIDTMIRELLMCIIFD